LNYGSDVGMIGRTMPGTEALLWGTMTAHLLYHFIDEIELAVKRGHVLQANLEVLVPT